MFFFIMNIDPGYLCTEYPKNPKEPIFFLENIYN